MNVVIERIESAVNKVSNKFNSSGLLHGVNKILGTDIKLPSVSIPRLASGGVITSPTVAMMGEYSGARSNPEIVAPQDLLEGIITSGNDELIAVFTQGLYQIVEAINNKDLDISIGDETIARSAARGNKSYQRRTGNPIFSY